MGRRGVASSEKKVRGAAPERQSLSAEQAAEPNEMGVFEMGLRPPQMWKLQSGNYRLKRPSEHTNLYLKLFISFLASVQLMNLWNSDKRESLTDLVESAV